MGVVFIRATLDETGERIAIPVDASRKDALLSAYKSHAIQSGGLGSPSAPLSGKPCDDCGKGTFWSNLASTIKDTAQLARTAAQLMQGKEAPAEIVATRAAVCEGCTSVDANGERLYREVQIMGGAYHTCGSLRLTDLVRDSAANGCGCILEIKRLGVDAQCPLGKWKE